MPIERAHAKREAVARDSLVQQASSLALFVDIVSIASICPLTVAVLALKRVIIALHVAFARSTNARVDANTYAQILVTVASRRLNPPMAF